MTEPSVAAGASLTPGVAVHPLDPAHDAQAATILADCMLDGTAASGRDLLAAARYDAESTVTGIIENDVVVAVCLTRKVPMAVEVTHLAVADGHRRRGYGRACLQDALRRAGKRPLVAETDDDARGFFQACGFKLVGKRKHPDGPVRFRLGWHAPSAQATRSAVSRTAAGRPDDEAPAPNEA